MILQKVKNAVAYWRKNGNNDMMIHLFRKIRERLIGEYLFWKWWLFSRFQNFWKGGLNTEMREQQIIVSVTSYPARIRHIALVLIQMFRQTMKPDRVILTLAATQFPNRENDLPKSLLRLREKGLEIQWQNEDIRSHKKYYYVMRDNPGAFVVTIDDDMFYWRTMLETLWQKHTEYPHAVICHESKKMLFDAKTGVPRPYMEWFWPDQDQYVRSENQCDLIIGCGGTLFPPNVLHKEIFNKQRFLKLCPAADDFWLTIMALKNGSTIEHAYDKNKSFHSLPRNAGEGLFMYNDHCGGNDVQFKALLDYYDKDGSLLRMMNGTV